MASIFHQQMHELFLFGKKINAGRAGLQKILEVPEHHKYDENRRNEKYISHQQILIAVTRTSRGNLSQSVD